MSPVGDVFVILINKVRECDLHHEPKLLMREHGKTQLTHPLRITYRQLLTWDYQYHK